MDLVIIQVLLSVVKFLDFLRPYEGLVGSLTGLTNGGPGTTFPQLVLVFIAIFIIMEFKAKHWLVVFGVLFMGFLAGKRAVWIIFPVLLILLNLFIYIVFVPFLFYISLRVMPTLNPENVFWGSFDPYYALDYGIKYSSGAEGSNDEIDEGTGRIDALVLAYSQIDADPFSENIWYGYGFQRLIVTNDNYYDQNY